MSWGTPGMVWAARLALKSPPTSRERGKAARPPFPSGLQHQPTPESTCPAALTPVQLPITQGQLA